MKRLRFLAGVCAVALLCGCTVGREASIPEQTEEEKTTFRTALTDFACRTGTELLDGQENGCYAPGSLYAALAMTAQTVTGEAETQLLEVMGAADRAALLEGCAAYQARTQTAEESTLRWAQSVWYDKAYTLRQPFADRVEELMDASIFAVDFADPATGTEMGNWIAGQTEGLLAPVFQLRAEECATLLSTVYFCSPWQDTFSAHNTEPAPFYTAAGEVEVQFMHQSDDGTVWEGEGFLRASLPLETGRFVVVLPTDGQTVEDLLASAETLHTALTGGTESEAWVQWSLPRFTIDAGYTLEQEGETLGLDLLFDPANAGMAGLFEEDVPLMISRILQETHFGLDEDGVEAAAYTAVMVGEGAAPPAREVELTLDHPFLYAVMVEDTPLFLGVVADPTAG